jgi:hypothetical protein
MGLINAVRPEHSKLIMNSHVAVQCAIRMSMRALLMSLSLVGWKLEQLRAMEKSHKQRRILLM